MAAEPAPLDEELLDDGWIQLFDGHSLFGWQKVGDAEWEIEEGTIRTSGERPGFLMTTGKWADYVLHVEYKAFDKTNSGVFLRTPLEPTNPAADCYELNIAPPENAFPTGSLVGRQRRATDGRKTPDAGAWQTFEVTVRGGHVSVRDGTGLILEYDDPSPLPRNPIALQSNSGPVEFRNVRIRPTGFAPIFTGKDLAGWNSDRAEQSKFEVTPEESLRVTKGPGQIESDGEYANFVLGLECRIDGDGLNSGIFFRTLRTGRWTGYESQIHNVYRDGDRTKPRDFGTGGIYRRQPARRVVADDREWFHKTIVADGPHMAVWVDGYPVSDWTDERPPHESPREGRRDGPGAIAIQGHDPTTDLRFRNLRIIDLGE